MFTLIVQRIPMTVKGNFIYIYIYIYIYIKNLEKVVSTCKKKNSLVESENLEDSFVTYLKIEKGINIVVRYWLKLLLNFITTSVDLKKFQYTFCFVSSNNFIFMSTHEYFHIYFSVIMTAN
jgi:hypothetical protein